MRGHISRRGGATPQHRMLCSPTNPTHPPTTLAVGRTVSALNFIIAARFFKISFAILKFRVAKIAKFQLLYKSALYFAKIPIKF
ncbi:hypothetical protein [uncultured Campylobacter sp.]|uniref:hypothetical protein n=1 Tax=uncultured Campylobacter sp. TaxID=218934 RepID=UPI002606F049|nr:hypothetical protein [uncultured Campylobacter sp.]